MKLDRYKHIIWDWNGTLLNDARLCVESVNLVLAKRGLKRMTIEHYQKTFDFPVIDFYRRLGFDLKKESFSDIAVEYHAIYENRWPECDLQPGAVELLGLIAEKGLTQSLLSAAPQLLLDDGVRHYQLEHFFVKTIGLENNQAHGKIDNGKRWIKQLEHLPHEVLLIGDTTHDYHVAKAIGADCMLVLGGHHHREKLQACPVPIYDSLEELIDS